MPEVWIAYCGFTVGATAALVVLVMGILKKGKD